MKKKKFFDEHISKALNRYLSTDNKKLSDNYLQSRIAIILKEKLGKLIGGYTTEVFYKQGRLWISLNSAPLKSELSQSKDKLIKILNEELKGDYVKMVYFK